jgi:predicted DNA-binding transcriptional regulator AlpA
MSGDVANNCSKQVQAAGFAPLLVPARAAARIAGISPATWSRLRASDKVPAPVRLGGRVLWRVEELRAWIAAGCPDGQKWRALRDAARR